MPLTVEPTFTFSQFKSTGIYQASPGNTQLVVNGQPSELIKFEPNSVTITKTVNIDAELFVYGEKVDIAALSKLGKKPIITIMDGKEQVGILNLATMHFYGKIQGDSHNTTVCIFDSWLTATIVITWMIKHVVMWVKEKYELGKKIQEMEELYK